MPSARRVRLLALAAIVTVVFVLFYGSGFGGRGQSADFYHKTMDAMHGRSPGKPVIDSETGLRTGHIPQDRDGDGDIDEDDHKAGKDLQDRLSKLAQEAKDNANEKAPKPDSPSKLIGVGNSAEGNKKPAEEKAASIKPAAPAEPPAAAAKGKERIEESKAEQVLHAILKQSPVIIFSKTYCPHSKRAKGILLEKYIIKPKPFVVELDKPVSVGSFTDLDIGSDLQDVLEGLTGRRTVPNIMVNSVSVGGADTIVDLDNSGKLISKFQELGNRKVEISQHFAAEEVKGAAPAN